MIFFFFRELKKDQLRYLRENWLPTFTDPHFKVDIPERVISNMSLGKCCTILIDLVFLKSRQSRVQTSINHCVNSVTTSKCKFLNFYLVPRSMERWVNAPLLSFSF